MSIAATALPAISYCSKLNSYNRLVSDGPMRFLRRTDDQRSAESWQLQWRDAEPEVVEAVLLHYETHGQGTFKWKAPSDSAATTWRYDGPPAVQLVTARTASIAVQVERVLAFIP